MKTRKATRTQRYRFTKLQCADVNLNYLSAEDDELLEQMALATSSDRFTAAKVPDALWALPFEVEAAGLGKRLIVIEKDFRKRHIKEMQEAGFSREFSRLIWELKRQKTCRLYVREKGGLVSGAPMIGYHHA